MVINNNNDCLITIECLMHFVKYMQIALHISYYADIMLNVSLTHYAQYYAGIIGRSL